MNKNSPHEAFGKTLMNAGERLQIIGGEFYTGRVDFVLSGEIQAFHRFKGMAEPESKAILIHWICTSRVHPVRGKGLSHLVVVFDPDIHSLLPDVADHGRPRRSDSCLYANYPPAPTLNT